MINPKLRMGPYSPNALSQEQNWQQYWLLNRSDIDQHLQNFSNPGYTVPYKIATWPAHGDTILGESYQLAPFHDYNNNGYYDPENGDYPMIKGSKCVYSIMNDVFNGTNSTQIAEQLNIEVHKMMYSFDCQSDSALVNTLFVDQRIINKGNYPINELTLGVRTDFDIGLPYDDYVATDVERGIIYGYSADVYDENGSGALVYGDFIASQCTGILRGMRLTNDGVDNGVTHQTPSSYNGFGFNDGIIDNEYYGMTSSIYFGNPGLPYQHSPFNHTHFWNYINGKWIDGTDMQYGGFGHLSNAPTNYVSKYFYPGDSDPNNYGTSGIDPGFIWSEDSMGSIAGDRRALASSKGGTLNPEEETTFTYYYTYGNDRQTPGRFPSVTKMKGFVDDIRSYFHANQTPCGSDFDFYQAHQFMSLNENDLGNSIVVYPNPANNKITISGIDLEKAFVQIYDSRGALVYKTDNPESATIDISQFEEGVYILSILREEGVISKKIIKE